MTAARFCFLGHAETIARSVIAQLSAISDARVGDVSASEIAAALRMAGDSEWTRTAVYRLARGVFDHAVRRGLVTRNPVDGLGRAERPSQQNAKEVRVLDAVETKALIGAAATARWRVALGLMGLAGVRLGEMRALTWGDVSDLSIRVARSATPDGAMKTTKTRAGVPMSRSPPRCADCSLSGGSSRIARATTT